MKKNITNIGLLLNTFKMYINNFNRWILIFFFNFPKITYKNLKQKECENRKSAFLKVF